MRRFPLAVLVLAAAACSRAPAPEASTHAPLPVPVAAPVPGPAQKTPPPTLRPPPAAGAARIAFLSRTDAGAREVWLAPEDAPSTMTRASIAGTDTTFGGALGNGAFLLAEHDAKGDIARVVRVGDGGTRILVGEVDAGVYDRVMTAKDAGRGAFALLLSRSATSSNDLVLLAPGSAPKLVAHDASLVTVAEGRIVYFSGTALASVASDGSDLVALGGGDDAVVDSAGGRLLVNAGGGASKDVRLVSLDGTRRFSLASDADEVAAGMTDGRVVFTRAGSLVAVPVDGGPEIVLASPDLEPRALGVAPGGVALWGDVTGALLAADVHDGVSRVLDPAAGANVTLSRVAGDRALYVGDTPHWKSLRSAKLDGTGADVLYELQPWLPFVVAVDGPDVVVHRVLAGQPGGGRVSAMPIAGGDVTAVGAFVQGPAGDVTAAPVADQDFESVTPNGSLVVEAEMEALGSSQLYLLAHAGAPAELVTGDLAHIRFAGVVP